MSEVLDRLKALEERVARIKDWKQQYDQDKKKWEGEKKELNKLLEGASRFTKAIRDFLSPYFKTPPADATGQANSLNVNLEETQLNVNVTHQEKDINMTTSKVLGKVLFCALTDLPREGFTEEDLSVELKERGWNIGHTTLAPTLGGCVKDGYLVRIEGSRPSKYRLPAKLNMNVQRD